MCVTNVFLVCVRSTEYFSKCIKMCIFATQYCTKIKLIYDVFSNDCLNFLKKPELPRFCAAVQLYSF